MTALCGYQSGRWGGQQARLYSMANANRVLSAEAADKPLAFNAINVNLFLHYVDASPPPLAPFAAILTSIVRRCNRPYRTTAL